MFSFPVRLALIFVLGLCGAVACGQRAVPVAHVPPPSAPVTASPPPPPPPLPPSEAVSAPPAIASEAELFARKTLDELNAERPLGDALFDLDQFTLREDARLVLHENAGWMRQWPSTRITVEGHADDRGTSEYNLALGQRRSAAVKDYLVSLGIASDRVDVISKGEDAPVCTEPREDCWQRNRRGQSIITAK